MNGQILDEALERLQPYAPEFKGVLSNHGPMVIETLARCGRQDAIHAWLDSYLPVLEPAWQGGERVEASTWRQLLGVKTSFAGWRDFFANALEESDWQSVVGIWADRLAPGLLGGATHGFIRTAHAVMAIQAEETPLRRDELVSALAYWAAGYTTLPQAPVATKLSLDEAVAALPSLPAEVLSLRGWQDRVAALPEFTIVTDSVVLPDDPAIALAGLTRTFASLYLNNSHLKGRVVIPIHAVTCATAARRLLPFVSSSTAGLLLRYVWQAGAAIVVSHAEERTVVLEGGKSSGWDAIFEQAVAGKDEHAIKFTDACRMEDEEAAAPVYALAAEDACRRLAPD